MTGEIGNGKVTKDKTTTKNTPSNNFDNEIIAGRVFNQKEDTYMVLIFSNDDIKDELKSTINKYDVSKKDVKLYKVNKDEAVNKYISSDYDNNTPISSKDLKVKKMALLTISKGVVSSYITDEEEIINVLK